MGKEKAGKAFKIGDLVFAKLKGYPAWPAKITKYNNKKYNVFFYGTGDTAYIKVEDLFPYADNKEKFATAKNMRRAKFSEAVDQIESVLRGDDSTSVASSTADAVKPMASEATSVATSSGTSSSIALAEVARRQKARVSAAGGRKWTTTVQAQRQRHVDGDTEDTSSSDAVCTEDASSSDAVMTPPPPKKRVPPEGIGAPSSQSSKRIVKKSRASVAVTPMPKRSSQANVVETNLLMVYMPMAKCLGINMDYKKPKSFENAAAEQAWLDQARKEAIELKLKLESGQIEAESMPERIVIEPLRNAIPKQEAERFVGELIEQEDALFMERDFVELSMQLQECLGLHRANVGRCLKILKQLKDFELTKLMLLRNPDCVDTMRRLRRYVGNLELWKMDKSDELEFKEHAQTIRQMSTDIYNGFKALFSPEPDPEDKFWLEFSKKVRIYNNHTKDINDNLCVSMSQLSYDNLVKAKEMDAASKENVQD
ncbi:hypothetical protein ACLKA7_006058 [Drosophila subpalustris]